MSELRSSIIESLHLPDRGAEPGPDYRAYFEGTGRASVVLDASGRAIAANAAFRRLLGYQEGTVEGLPFLALLDAARGWRDLRPFAQVMEGEAQAHLAEGWLTRTDGAEMRVELRLFSSGGVGAARQTFAVLEDVGERKRSEEALRASEVSIQALHGIAASSRDRAEKLASILELGRERFGMATGILSRVDEGRYEVVEAAAWGAGIPRGRTLQLERLFCSRTVQEEGVVAVERGGELEWLAHPAYGEGRVEAYLGAPVMVGERVYGTLCFCDPAPRATPFTAAEKDFLQLMARWVGGELAHARAESALREREEQLLHAQKMEAVGRLAGGVAHDFNNLLMAIKGHVEFLLQHRDWADSVLEELFEINHAAVRSQRLVQQLMAFSRKQVLQPQVLDLNGLVDEMARMLERLLGDHVRLVRELDPALGRVRADQSQLEQVIVNLVVNARDAMPGGGTLSIRTSNEEQAEWEVESTPLPRVGPAVVLTVTDTGTGMEESVRRHVFEPFFTTKGPDRGTGLGLATVYGIVRQSGGSITVTSEPGRGTTFRIVLPRAAPGVSDTRPAVPVGPLTERHGSETVLLVEDETMIRKLTTRMLEKCGYRVLAAADGAEALETCQAHDGPIHLLLTDIVMPRMGGRELGRRVYELRPDVRIVYMSGYTGEEALDLAGLEDDAAFLQKPVQLDTLARTVRALLDGAAWAERPGGERDGAADTR